MSTESQVNANRENAKKSTGPKTTKGKETSAQNATKHGLFTQQDVIKYESQVDYDMFRGEMLEDLNAIGPMQYRLADRIVSLSWRLKRVERIHNQTIEIMLEKDALKYKTKTDRKYADPYKYDPDLALGRITMKDFSDERVFDRLIMYERRIENSLYKSIKELKKLKSEKSINQSRPKAESNTQYDIRNTQYEINMQNKPNLHDQTNLTPAISKDYENERPGELLQKIINQSRPRAESTIFPFSF